MSVFTTLFTIYLFILYLLLNGYVVFSCCFLIVKLRADVKMNGYLSPRVTLNDDYYLCVQVQKQLNECQLSYG